jgi:hypothetical protein
MKTSSIRNQFIKISRSKFTLINGRGFSIQPSTHKIALLKRAAVENEISNDFSSILAEITRGAAVRQWYSLSDFDDI